MIETLKNIGIIIGLPVLRSVAGWAVSALEDLKVNTFEWKQLVQTVIRVGMIGGVAYIGFDAAGYDIPAISVAAGAFLADIFFGALKDAKKTTTTKVKP